MIPPSWLVSPLGRGPIDLLLRAWTSTAHCFQNPINPVCAFGEQGDQRPLTPLFLVCRGRRAESVPVVALLHILLPPSAANNFSTSAIMTSEPASSMLPTRCQRMTPC